jgi:hypothetical protein
MLTASPKYVNDVELAGTQLSIAGFFGKTSLFYSRMMDRKPFTLTASRCQVTTVAVRQRQT